MKRMILLALIMTLALVLTFPAAAQGNDWSVYLFDKASRQIIRIYLDGRQKTYDLGLPSGEYVSGRVSIDFSPDGNRVAYCTNAEADAHSELVVRDIDRHECAACSGEFRESARLLGQIQ